jgi:hypothetical protein
VVDDLRWSTTRSSSRLVVVVIAVDMAPTDMVVVVVE